MRDLDTRDLRGLRVQVADERALGLPTGASALSAIAPAAIVQGIYGTLDGSPVRQSGDMCLRVTVRGRSKPMGFCNTYVGGGGSPDALAGGPIVADAAAATQILDAYDAGPLTVTRVEIGLRVARGLRLATLRSLSGPRVVRRGSTISVRATLRRPGGARHAPHDPRARSRAGCRPVRATSSSRGPRPTSTTGGRDDETTIDLSSLFETGSGEAAPGPGSVAALARHRSPTCTATTA